MKRLLMVVFCIIYYSTMFAQSANPSLGEVFRDNVIPRIDITIPQSSLNAIYSDVWSYTEHKARFIFDNGTVRDTLEDIGFRLRGNTSRSSQKKSFKVSFNTFETGRKYYGLEKLNLNGEHNDPTITRSKLCWDMLRDMNIAAPRANHVELYINNNYYGLYINIEHIDEEFAESRFGNKDGNLYKGFWGVNFNYKGSNPDLYKFEDNGRRVYSLKTNTDVDDYSDLAEFIAVLNNTPLYDLPCKLEKVFNVEQYLKVLAFDVIAANWDGPVWNQNNCYIYKNTTTGKFEYIPYDLDNTLGVSWFSNINWGNRDIYQWSASWGNRPTYERILQVQEYKDRYTYYINEIIGLLDSATYFPKIDAVKAMITTSAINDNYRTLDYGFSVQDFHDSYNQSVGSHLPYGIKDYLMTRTQSAASQMNLNDILPVIKDLKTSVSIENQSMDILVNVFDDNTNLTVEAKWKEDNGNWNSTALFDDGNHNDESANDGIFGGTINLFLTSGTITYYVEATDNQSNNSRFPRCDDKSFLYNPQTPKLVINEFMASNETAYADDAGEYDDWIEIYNGEETNIDLSGIYLSDNSDNPTKWALPNITMLPNSYLLIWADSDGNQGANHANFKLKKDGETIGLYFGEDFGFAPIDEYNYPVQTTDISYGRLPNGTGEFQELSFISPNFNNEDTLIVIDPPIEITEMLLYPNPFSESITIKHPYENPMIRIYNSIGQLVFYEETITSEFVWNGVNDTGVPLSTGIYFISLLEKNDKNEFIVSETKRVFISR